MPTNGVKEELCDWQGEFGIENAGNGLNRKKQSEEVLRYLAWSREIQ